MSLIDDFVGKAAAGAGHDPTLSDTLDNGLAQFRVDPVSLPGSLDIVCAAVKNNILVIAVANNKLLKIDLANPAEIQDLEIPRSKGGDISNVKKIFLDDTGHHLFVTLEKGENWYLHAKLSKPAKLKVRGVVESIAWNQSGTEYATKEILLGLAAGSIIETWLEPLEGFSKTAERYSRQIHSLASGEPVRGLCLYAGATPREMNLLIGTETTVFHYKGVVGSSGGDSHVLAGLFTSPPGEQEYAPLGASSRLSLVNADDSLSKNHYAWLNSAGILHGPAPSSEPGNSSFEDSTLIGMEQLEKEHVDDRTFLELSRFHALLLRNNTIYAFNRFDDRKVYQDKVSTLDALVGMMADPVQQTYWVYSRTELFEIVITDEAQHMWRIFLARRDFDMALKYTSDPEKINTIHVMQAQSLMARQDYLRAAEIFAKTSEPIEQVAIGFLDLDNRDALLSYLLKKLEGLKKSAEMQRTMIATWILELFLNKMSAMDDLHNNMRDATDHSTEKDRVKAQYSMFIAKHKLDLDKSTTYALINSHGRHEELMVFANAIDDYEYIVQYYIQQDKYLEALTLLSKHSNAELTYATSTILLPEIPEETVEMWMRLPSLEPSRLLPAILAYNSRRSVSINENQAVRYLHFTIKHQGVTDTATHNALIGIYARDCAGDETALLSFLESQDKHPYYDLDFALRQCKQYDRLMSCVHLYSLMGFYDQAVQWALQHENLQLAGVVADRVEDNPLLRKKLWLMIAKKTIAQEGGVKKAIEISKRTDVLRIEDLVPHFDEFAIIDDFKDEICAALEGYSTNIEALRQEMDESSRTAETINQNILDLKKRFAIIRVGEECYKCHRPLFEKQAYVFPCQHAFHSDCLLASALQGAAPFQRRRLAQLQSQIARSQAIVNQQNNNGAKETRSDVANNGVTSAAEIQKQLQAQMDELDDIVAAACLLCGSAMIRSIDEGFLAKDDKQELAAAASWQL